MPRAYAAAAAALLFPLASGGHAQTTAPAPSPIELRISGPRLIRRGDRLKFTATLINRSSTPVALIFYQEGQYISTFHWKITDSVDRVLPPPERTLQGVCLVSGANSEDGIKVLQPGQQFVYAIPEDPSDEFVFRGKGFYKAVLTYVFDPSSVYSVKDAERDFRGTPYAAGPYPKRELLLKTPRTTVTSNVWQMYLTD